jgi:hypothetical protein
VVQACHACLEAARALLPSEQEHPHLVVCGVPDEVRLGTCLDRLRRAGVRFRAFHEPDLGGALTAAATEPVRGAQRLLFRDSQLLRGGGEDEAPGSPSSYPSERGDDMAHRSRWGWHPCDYETYLLLKALSARCEKARRQYSAWQRWERKMPHNRVIRRKVKDDQGRVTGREAVGPRPEPPLPALFCRRYQAVARGRAAEQVAFSDLGIPAAYRAARKPAATKERVEPLALTAEQIRRLWALADEQPGTTE